MPPRRLHPIDSPVSLRVDGDEVPARAGEPLAVSLIASGRWVLGRSVKYHRPRGPACLRARCDGCLMRVDGVGNTRTCVTPARDRAVIETQNVLGTARTDLLAATDWFFPEGMDHHTMFTRFRAVNRVMQKVARRVAGIGRLPDVVATSIPPRDASVDVLVVGGGPSGMAAATACAEAGLSVWLVEESSRLFGHVRRAPLHDEQKRACVGLEARLRATSARISTRHAAVGVYDGVVAVVSDEGLVRVTARRLVIATGTHEGCVPVPGNETPGAIGLDAASELLAEGVLPGERIVVVLGAGEQAQPATRARLEAFAAAARGVGAQVIGPYDAAMVAAIKGRPQVRRVTITRASGETDDVSCDCVVLAAEPSSAYEIGAQAGATVTFRNGRFDLECDAEGRTASPSVFAIGECTGEPALELDALFRLARRAAAVIAQELGHGG